MINRVLVLQALADVANICYCDKANDKALNIVTTYMELTIRLKDIYLFNCNIYC